MLKTLDELMGPADFIWDECQPRSVKLTDRDPNDIFFVQHHSVSRTLGAILDVFKSPNRSVSGNAAVGPLVAGQDNYHVRHTVPWNTHRAYTTGSFIDDKAITNEMANLSLNPPYPVGQTGKQWAAEVVAAMHVELGMPIDRFHVTCHREVYQRGWGSYATACPGDDLHAALDWICEEAKRIVANGGSTAGGGVVPIGKEYPMFAIVPEAYSDAIWCQSLVNGKRVLIMSPYDVSLLQRVRDNDNNDEMLAQEMDIVSGYLIALGASPNDTERIIAAIQGNKPTIPAGEVQAAVKAALEGVALIDDDDLVKIGNSVADTLKARL